MKLSFGNMTVNLNIFNVIKEIGDDEDVCEVNMIEYVVQNYVDHPSQVCIPRGRRNFSGNHILLFKVRSRE